MVQAADLSIFVRRQGSHEQMTLAVEGIGCAGCIRKIETGLKRVPGIVDARVNFSNRRLAVTWRAGVIDAGAVVEALQRIGYRSHPFQAAGAEAAEAAHGRWLLRCLAVAGFAAMNIMLLSVSVWSGNVSDITQETRDFFHWLSALIALPAAAYAGQPFFQSAWRVLSARQVNMDVPISLGVMLALGLSLVETANHAQHAYFDSAVMLLFFLLCGRYLDHAMRQKTRAVAGNLAALKADVAHRLDGHEVVMVPAAALKTGDRILVRPGDRIPADGVVLGGTSDIDESLVTGETVRRTVVSGTTVYAGSINYSGALTVSVTAAGRTTLIDEIETLLEQAVAAKSRYVRLADRAARLYAPVVHTAAALTAIGWLASGASLHDSIVVAISVLIITCPCALALAIPAVQVVASGALFRSGLIVSSGDAIERIAETDLVIFDKTGTLTLPDPCVRNRAEVPADLLEAAARLALSSRHPLAAALAREAASAVPYDNAAEEPGQGVRASIDGVDARLGSLRFCGLEPGCEAAGDPATSSIAFRLGDRQAVFVVSQSLRPDAVAAARQLRALGRHLVILSGDRAEAVEPVASALGISDWHAGLKPAEKIAFIERVKAQGHRVLMVGDGLNDAPALAAAHASISPISAAHLAQAQADAVFMGERLAPVADAVSITRKARGLMRQNLVLAALYNAVAVPIAVAGLVTPLIAAAAMSASSILVTLNALRGRITRSGVAGGLGDGGMGEHDGGPGATAAASDAKPRAVLQEARPV
ncbi:MAG: cadmium-translocating P-type ATPase [Hyphomicrobiales bacterium]|nr:cadmium-translocating P-type ATPase [Hyphomicrobiales bacterium]